jgi:hypothetical protein
MGQLFSRQAAPEHLRHGTKQPTSHSEPPKLAKSSETADESTFRSGLKASHQKSRSAHGRVNSSFTDYRKVNAAVYEHSSTCRDRVTSSERKKSVDSKTHNHGHSKTLASHDRQRPPKIEASSLNHLRQSSLASSGPSHKRSPKRTEKKECIVCSDKRSSRHFPNRPPTTQCSHLIEVCRRCLRTWIASQFSTKMWNEINCPMCPKRLQYEDMQAFAPSDVFRR